jgi:S-disulfanyl-L-cysteine oxidoreductase SoxD
MIRLVLVSRRAIRLVSGMMLCVCAVLAGGWITVSAGQLRSITEGVYSSQQADRAKPVYEAQCAMCHGTALQGAVGSPLTGDIFLANWSGRPLSNLVEKIEKTMPFYSPGSLSRQQATDLTAYILEVGKFPAGTAELNENGLALIALPTVKSSGAKVPAGTLAELMRAIAFPNANILFNLQLKDPSNEPKPEMPVPYDYVKWGFTIYPGWLAIDQAALALSESAPLLLTPGRLCQNGKPAPVDRADWKKYVADLVEVAQFAYKTAKARDYEAFADFSDKLTNACGNCHKVYRDAGGTEGSGMQRCQVPNP